MSLINALKHLATPAIGLAVLLSAAAHGVVQAAPADKAASKAVERAAQGQAPGRSARGDSDGDGISDALAAKLLTAAPGEFFDVIVVFDGPRASERAREAAGPFQIEREFTIINGFQASMPAARIWALSNAPGLVRIQENGEVTANDVPSNDDTGVTAARSSFIVDGTGVTVCVLDTGINPNHEQFDTRAWAPGDFMDFTSAATSPYDDVGHGSHVAGILAGDGVGAETEIAPQAAGVAPGVTLKIGKVLNSSGSGSDAAVVAGIEWCAGVGDIVSMSLGGNPTDGSDVLSLAANCAADPDYDVGCGNTDPVIVVVSAGNSGAEPGTSGTPGVAANSITVGSFAEWSGEPGLGWQDDGVYLNPFSSRGPVMDDTGAALWIKPDIVGPGARVLSAYINSANPAEQVPDIYAVADGTSMSTPFVAGVIALMLEADPTLGVWDQGGSDSRLPH
jgi:serine protease AprX